MTHEAHDTSSDPIGELLARVLGVVSSERPRTVTEWVATQSMDGFVYQTAVEGAPCLGGCGGAEGFAIGVTDRTCASGVLPASHRILIKSFEPHRGTDRSVCMSAEQAKELVNRLGEAIAAAERIDASSAT